jgi:PEP-CTERM motif
MRSSGGVVRSSSILIFGKGEFEMETCWKSAACRISQFMVVAGLAAVALPTWGQLPLFNGAEGFGGTFTGSAPAGGWFSNAQIYHVTTTADTLDGNGKPVFGTLRGAFQDYTNPNSVKQQASNRIVVFDVGGTFQLTQGSLDMKTINNIYIAGQTAPSQVVVYGDTSQITHSSNTANSNVILRYMTFRKGTGNGADSITFAGGSSDGSGSFATNMILDHVSASWSEDEVCSVANNNTNVTVQYTMMTDSLTSGHQYGTLLRPRINASVTLHHNLYGNDASRNPRFGSYNNMLLTADFVDNVIYNWSSRAGYAGGGSDGGITEKANVNWVGNYAIAGPATPLGSTSTTAFTKDISGTNAIEVGVYQALNLIDSNHNAVRDGTDTGWGAFRVSDGSSLPVADQRATPFATPAVTTTGAADAYNQVLNYVGNYWWSRDAIDQRIISNVQNYTQPAGGIPATAPVPAELTGVLTNPTTTRSAGYDSDGDGMPDVWEAKYGLNPSSAVDAFTDFDGDGYVNVQEYLDETGAFPAPAPIDFNGATNNRFAVITNWKTNDGGVTTGSNWQPTRFDEARINSGTVVVDAAGQHAGTLKIGAQAGNTGTLNLTSGWLEVNTEVIVGADPAATGVFTMSGGTLSVPTLSKGGVGSAFNLTGGTLHADTVNFTLVNNGGTISPGHSIGQTHVAGDLTLNSGSLALELASASMADTLLVDGAAALGGALNISLLNGFAPTNGQTWQIIATGGGITGAFGSITAGYSVFQQGNNLVLLFGTAALAGDYNHNGVVDASDYTVWRDSFGQTGTGLAADGDGSGTVDQGDYDLWTMNFGNTSPGSGAGSSVTVPEPATIWLAAMGMLAAAGWTRFGASRRK